MDKYLKLVPYGLMLAFGIQGLLNGFNWPMTSAFAALGLTCFLLEKCLDKKDILSMREDQMINKHKTEKIEKELESVKAFVTSQKLNSIQGLRSNGINKPAQY